MVTPIRVLVADNQPIFCAGVRAQLSLVVDVDWIGEVNDLDQLYALKVKHPPDVLLLATNLMTDPVIKTVVACKEKFVSSKILVMFNRHDGLRLWQLKAPEVEGCILKTRHPQKFIEAIQTVAQGDTWFSSLYWQMVRQPEAIPVTLAELEKQLASFLITDMTIEEVAKALFVSESTLKRHLLELYAKLGVKSRLTAAVKIAKLGLA